MGTVALVRHGETTWNREGRVQGWADASLTDRGRRQARAAGERLRADLDPDRVVASDLERTRETAEILREAGAASRLEFRRAWRERDFGAHQGLTKAVIAARREDYRPDDSLVAVESVPEGESRGAFASRVGAAFDDLVDELAPDEAVAVVTHGGPIRVVLARATGRDLPTLASEFSPTNCGITVVDCDGSDLAVVEVDGCDHLADA